MFCGGQACTDANKKMSVQFQRFAGACASSSAEASTKSWVDGSAMKSGNVPFPRFKGVHAVDVVAPPS